MPTKLFKQSMTIDEILDKMDLEGDQTRIANAGQAFLQYKLHEELLKQQGEFLRKQLNRTTLLVVGTWALVLATLAIAISNYFLCAK